MFAHAAGVWAYKYKGKFYYFGPWNDPQGALKRFETEMPFIYQGKTPPARVVDVGTLLDGFLGAKTADRDEGTITESTLKEYKAATDVIFNHFGEHWPVDAIGTKDLQDLRKALGKGTRKGVKTLSPVTLKRRLTIARMVFAYANEEFDVKVKYRKPLKSPPRVNIKAAEREHGLLLYEVDDVRKLIKKAVGEFKAMLLLGMNCAFGPRDCATLPAAQVDLAGGWHNYWRPKTQAERRCSLWPETIAAIKVVKGRELVFQGREWDRWMIGREFATLCELAKVKNQGFYSLRRTFETIATTADVPQAVIDSIMGHSKNDMASIYRQKVFDDHLRKCAEHVRDWYLGTVVLK